MLQQPLHLSEASLFHVNHTLSHHSCVEPLEGTGYFVTLRTKPKTTPGQDPFHDPNTMTNPITSLLSPYYNSPQHFLYCTLYLYLSHEVSFLLFNGLYLVVERIPYCERWRLDKIWDKSMNHDDNQTTTAAAEGGASSSRKKASTKHRAHSATSNTREPKLRLNATQQTRLFFQQLVEHIFFILPIFIVSYPFFGQYVHLSLASFNWKCFVWQFVYWNILEDALFYWIHRAWHSSSFLMRHVHWKHHSNHSPVSVVGEEASPVEFVLNFIFPFLVGPWIEAVLFRRLHIISFTIWMFYRQMRSCDAHSGYKIPYHPLNLLNGLYGGSEYHFKHHHAVLSGGLQSNFGGYRFWDWLMKTRYEDFLERKQKSQ